MISENSTTESNISLIKGIFQQIQQESTNKTLNFNFHNTVADISFLYYLTRVVGSQYNEINLITKQCSKSTIKFTIVELCILYSPTIMAPWGNKNIQHWISHFSDAIYAKLLLSCLIVLNLDHT